MCKLKGACQLNFVLDFKLLDEENFHNLLIMKVDHHTLGFRKREYGFKFSKKCKNSIRNLRSDI